MQTGAALPRLSFQALGAQGVMLFSGYGLSQGLSFARNALLGHALSPRDFGIAASITLLLQLVETLSDIGSDRLIVQAEDGGEPLFMATAHTVLAARGVLLALVMLIAGPAAARFFAVPEAAGAFQWAALVPLVKGFTHLDCRRAQRAYDNRPQLIVETIPQAAALFATIPIVRLSPDFTAVVVLAIVQAATSVLVSRLVSTSPYAFAADRDAAARLVKFGWPILLSALPLVAVYQGDRTIIARLSGVEALAIYSAAFMITMVPGLIAARAGHSLMLPLFAETLRKGKPLARRFGFLGEVTAVFAALYLVLFTIAGDMLLSLTFGHGYRGHGDVVAALAAMWALRMVQAVPGMALMAAGETKPFLAAGLIRAAVLPAVLFTAQQGGALSHLAAIGCVGEVLSLIYVAVRLERLERGLGRLLIERTLFLVPSGIFAALAATVAGGHTPSAVLASLSAGVAVAATGIALMPSLRTHARRLFATLPAAVVE